MPLLVILIVVLAIYSAIQGDLAALRFLFAFDIVAFHPGWRSRRWAWASSRSASASRSWSPTRPTRAPDRSAARGDRHPPERHRDLLPRGHGGVPGRLRGGAGSLGRPGAHVRDAWPWPSRGSRSAPPPRIAFFVLLTSCGTRPRPCPSSSSPVARCPTRWAGRALGPCWRPDLCWALGLGYRPVVQRLGGLVSARQHPIFAKATLFDSSTTDVERTAAVGGFGLAIFVGWAGSQTASADQLGLARSASRFCAGCCAIWCPADLSVGGNHSTLFLVAING